MPLDEIDPHVAGDKRAAARLEIQDFFLEVAVAGYTGRVFDGRPVADSLQEMLANTDYAQGFQVLMAARGVDVQDIPAPIRIAFEFWMEMSMKSIIYSHGNLPGNLTHRLADEVSN